MNIGDWSNGMTGVSKTLSGSSILSSPVYRRLEVLGKQVFLAFLFRFSYFLTINKQISKFAQIYFTNSKTSSSDATFVMN